MHKGLLPVDAEYSEAITITVPEAIFGNYTVIVVADVYNTVYEHISENDNNLEVNKTLFTYNCITYMYL